MLELIGIVASIFAILGGVYGFYKKFIKPHTIRARLQNTSIMINDWFDYIDCNLETGINHAILNNKEQKIIEYIDNNLKHYWIRPNMKIIRAWNQEMDFKKELLDSTELFHRFSRVHPEGVPLDDFFMLLVGAFSSFHREYSLKKPGKYNYADIEMPVRFLRFYLRHI